MTTRPQYRGAGVGRRAARGGILHLVPDAVAATDLRARRGLCDSETVTEVREESGADYTRLGVD